MAAGVKQLRLASRSVARHCQRQRQRRCARCVCAASLDALNPNVAALRPSKTVALTDLARELKESGRDIVSLTAGEPDFDTPESVAAAGVSAIERGITHYAPNAGTAALRSAIVEKLARELEHAANEDRQAQAKLQ